MIIKKYTRKGQYGGKTYVFTHRNPQTNEVWSDEIPCRDTTKKVTLFGAWVSSEKVQWVE
jgi:hypothetical protein